ncbi:putative PEP-binding protein [Bradyrhizobium sp. IC3069]|uniref:putative PEP-binding protein n=1 Tax=unclassified Bradyrhizobium TaxID=2631580 RepID=UPI0031F64B92
MSLDPAICEGIGLVRTEFLFEASRGLPDEDTQYAGYRRILEWARRPVTIRTLFLKVNMPESPSRQNWAAVRFSLLGASDVRHGNHRAFARGSR